VPAWHDHENGRCWRPRRVYSAPQPEYSVLETFGQRHRARYRRCANRIMEATRLIREHGWPAPTGDRFLPVGFVGTCDESGSKALFASARIHQ